MATISAAQVKELRERTGLAMMDCKKALVETKGDMEAAIAHLREKNKGLNVKKADREANEGAVGVFVVEDGASGAIIEVNCENRFRGEKPRFPRTGLRFGLSSRDVRRCRCRDFSGPRFHQR